MQTQKGANGIWSPQVKCGFHKGNVHSKMTWKASAPGRDVSSNCSNTHNSEPLEMGTGSDLVWIPRAGHLTQI